MGRFIIYNKGDFVNGTEFIEEVEPYLYGKGNKARRGVFKCKYCGNNFTALIGNIRKVKHTTSCGCYNISNITRHGLCSHKLYKVRSAMIERCYNVNQRGFHRYGGRNISVCDSWRYDFKVFHDFCINNGWEVGLHIDRINNDGNYEPSNCRFVTPKINARNSSQTKLTIQDVYEIKHLLKHTSQTHISIGKLYNVGRECITDINQNTNWTDVQI